MENDELKKIWNSINTDAFHKSKEELDLLLASKTRQTFNKYLIIIGTSIAVSLALIVFLTFTSIRRHTDLFYVVNNLALGLITLTALFSGVYSWYQLANTPYDRPLKEWLGKRIKLLSGWLTGKQSKLYIFIIPVIYVLTVLSIHVYFEGKTFTEVLSTGESLAGLIVGAVIGLFVAYFTARKIRQYEMRNFEFLKSLYDRLGKM